MLLCGTWLVMFGWNVSDALTGRCMKYTQKTIEGYLNSFDNMIFDKIIFKQSIFVSDRTNNIQFSKMQNEIYGPLITIQYHTRCTNPLYPKFTSKNFSVFYYLLQRLPGHCLCSNSDHRQVFTPIFSVSVPNNVTVSSAKITRYGILQPIWQQIGSKTLTTTTKLGVILLNESRCNSLSCPPGQLAPHPGYLHPGGGGGGASCPGRFILPPANTSKNICMLFCYFSVSFLWIQVLYKS